jgi:hypothetical protein
MIESHAPSIHTALRLTSLPGHSAREGCWSLLISSQQGRALYTDGAGCLNSAFVLAESHITKGEVVGQPCIDDGILAGTLFFLPGNFQPKQALIG